MPKGKESSGRVQETAAPVEATTAAEPSEVDNEVEESVQETTRKALESLRAEANTEDGDSDGSEGAQETQTETAQAEPPPGSQTVRAPGQQKGTPRDDNGDFDPDLIAPSRLDDVGKELFGRLPKGLKKEFNRAVRELEGMTTRTQKEWASRFREHEQLEQVVRPHLASWAKAGHSMSSAVAELIETHQDLMNDSKKVDKWLWLAKNCNIDPVAVLQRLNGNGAQNGNGHHNGAGAQHPDISNHPEFVALRDTVNGITNEKAQHGIRLAYNDMAAVQHEKDPATGQYVRPMLLDGDFLEACKPLVRKELATVPGLTPGQALARVHDRITGRQTSSQPAVPNSLVTPPNTTQQRAHEAAVSVRGRSRPAASAMTIPDEIPDSPRETAALALEMLRRGG